MGKLIFSKMIMTDHSIENQILATIADFNGIRYEDLKSSHNLDDNELTLYLNQLRAKNRITRKSEKYYSMDDEEDATSTKADYRERVSEGYLENKKLRRDVGCLTDSLEQCKDKCQCLTEENEKLQQRVAQCTEALETNEREKEEASRTARQQMETNECEKQEASRAIKQQIETNEREKEEALVKYNAMQEKLSVTESRLRVLEHKNYSFTCNTMLLFIIIIMLLFGFGWIWQITSVVM
jgi:Fe2+ transport system protein B